MPQMRALTLLILGVAVCVNFAGCQKREPFAPEHRLLDLADDPDSPIKFDENVGEFQLVYEQVRNGQRIQRNIPLRYSPFTGAPLPSRRSELSKLFMQMSEDDVRMIREKLKDARTFADVEAVLGPPDSTLAAAAPGILLTPNVIAQHLYTNVAPTLEVYIKEFDDGRIEFGMYGKRKPR